MAVFEPTEDEKSAASYLDWDDAMLGKFTKYCGLVMEKNSKDAEGLHRVAAASCAMQLVSACLDSNAATLTLKLDGHTHSGVATGDWIVTVKRRKASPAFALRILRPRPARQCVRKLHEHGIEVSQARPTPAEGTDMSDFQRCPSCREYGWLNETSSLLRHVCKPAFECRPEWYGDEDDWSRVHAADSEEAAEKYAERYDCEGGDYPIVGGRMRADVIIQVRKPGDDEFERWAIEAEAVPTYRAIKQEPGRLPQASE